MSTLFTIFYLYCLGQPSRASFRHTLYFKISDSLCTWKFQVHPALQSLRFTLRYKVSGAPCTWKTSGTPCNISFRAPCSFKCQVHHVLNWMFQGHPPLACCWDTLHLHVSGTPFTCMLLGHPSLACFWDTLHLHVAGTPFTCMFLGHPSLACFSLYIGNTTLLIFTKSDIWKIF